MKRTLFLSILTIFTCIELSFAGNTYSKDEKSKLMIKLFNTEKSKSTCSLKINKAIRCYMDGPCYLISVAKLHAYGNIGYVFRNTRTKGELKRDLINGEEDNFPELRNEILAAADLYGCF